MTPIEARDALFAVVDGATVSPIQWPNVPFTPPANALWLRVTLQHAGEVNVSFGDDTTKRLWNSEGLLTIQIFAPKGNGQAIGYAEAHAHQNALRDTRINGIYLRNIRLRDIGTDGDYYQTQVQADFNYDEVR